MGGSLRSFLTPLSVCLEESRADQQMCKAIVGDTRDQPDSNTVWHSIALGLIHATTRATKLTPYYQRLQRKEKEKRKMEEEEEEEEVEEEAAPSLYHPTSVQLTLIRPLVFRHLEGA